ncbi:MAG: AcvB/VirJ family lysyl-phosphatidylglycerol hydrolase [Steroidobacteraceae bacterium]
MRLLALIVALLCADVASGAAPAQSIVYGKFGKVVLLRPAGTPKSVVLFLSDDAGWTQALNEFAQLLVAKGALVAGIDTPRYLAQLARKDDGCNYMAWDIEDLAHRVEKEIGFQQYLTPMIVGQGSGAATSYATLVQSSSGMFAGAVSLDFCPEQSFGGAPLCPGPAAGLRSYKTSGGALLLDPAPVLKDRWIAIQPKQDASCTGHNIDTFATRVGNSQVVRLRNAHEAGPQLVAAHDQLVAAVQARRLATSNSSSIGVDDLPLVELPTTVHSRRIALLITGDGGWAELDKAVSSALVARGVPVVGFNALKYFWGERTQEGTADDIARVLRHYLASWQASEILLVGYSFGADVMPFVINRLPADLRTRVVSATLLSLGSTASFEVHMAGWMGKAASDGVPTQPELAKIRDLPILCLYGAGDNESACDEFKGPTYTALTIGEGHHFSGQYAQLADSLLAFSAR